jgi:hypothetical protein
MTDDHDDHGIQTRIVSRALLRVGQSLATWHVTSGWCLCSFPPSPSRCVPPTWTPRSSPRSRPIINTNPHISLCINIFMVMLRFGERTFPGDLRPYFSLLCWFNSYLQVFDRLLLLRKGGQTVYFGDIGEGAQSIISYFETAGARKCRPEENPYVCIYHLLKSLWLSIQRGIHAWCYRCRSHCCCR